MQNPARDETIHPQQTQLDGVRVGTEEPRPWLASMPVCPQLDQHQILHAGIAHAPPGYRIVRMRQTTSFFLATLSGQGRVLVEGRWRPCKAGDACLLPAHILEAFATHGRRPWEFVWVCYRQSLGQRSLAGAPGPLLGAYDPQPLRHAVAGLRAECIASASPAAQHHWVELIHSGVLRFAMPFPADDPFSRLWAEVEADLAAEWSIASLARAAHCSGEQLRRLSLARFSRTPMKHVAHLRMRRAAELLASTTAKVEAVAEAVGYSNAFVFSNAFLRCTGLRPSAFRSQNP